MAASFISRSIATAAREIDAVRFDSKSGATSGELFPVFLSLSPRLSLTGVNAQALTIGVSKKTLITILCEQTSTIWVGDLVLHQR